MKVTGFAGYGCASAAVATSRLAQKNDFISFVIEALYPRKLVAIFTLLG
jgi:hypothetical protein